MRMNEQISLLICKHLVGSITEDEQRQLDEWRQRSPYNEKVYQRLHDNERLLVEHHRAQLADYQRPLADMKRQLAIGRRRQWPRWMAVAAIVLLLIGVGVYWQRAVRDVSPRHQEALAELIVPGTTQATLTLSSGETIQLDNDTLYPLHHSSAAARPIASAEAVPLHQLATPRGGEFRVVLEDGTEVWLNADTRLRYPEVFNGAERRVEVEGEAYFKVAKNSEHPFIVSSGGQEVRVYGTEFNVHAYPGETAIYTTLVEGSIALRLADEHDSSRELMLTPDHQSMFDVQSSTFNVKPVDTDVVTSWRSGVFVFEEQTLEQIMRTLSRWYDFDYEFGDRQTAETVFMGSIPKYGSFSEVCDIFHKLGGINLRQQGRKVTITAK